MWNKCTVFIALFLALTTTGLYGQVRLGLNMSRRSYLVGESITAAITIQSQSAVPLVFGSEYHNAELFIELSGGSLGNRGVPTRQRITRDFVIMPGSTVRDVVEITSLYAFLAAGNYRATLVLVADGRSFNSATFAFNVVSGIEMRSFRQMLPGYSDREIVYSFRYASRDGREMAFMVIQSPDGRSLYGTFALGPLLRLYTPVLRRRNDGSVIAIHQSGRNRFTRSTFIVDQGGAEFTEQRHFRSDGTPIPQQ